MSGERIVFVTFELYPLTAGGIGRAIYNMIMSVPQPERNRITVVLVGEHDNPSPTPAVLKDIEIVYANVNDEHGLLDGEATYPPRWTYSTEWHWRSYVAFRALQTIARSSGIEYIEFTDWGGLGYCTIQEKRQGADFLDVSIAIRLHGPHGVLLGTERYAVSENDLSIFDIERKALKDCDIVIAQTRPYIEKVREIFGFDGDEWSKRCLYSPLPVIVDSSPAARWTSTKTRRIAFTSKFQNIKRPEIFVRGVSQFLMADEGLGWNVSFCARIASDDQKREIVGKIPPSLKSRFEFQGHLQGRERDELIANSVVVICSACESFCLAAFEASLLGSLVILNATNPSFGDGTLWQDGVNCLKFDGTASGLSVALKRAANIETIDTVTLGSFDFPWTATLDLPVKPDDTVEPHVSVIVYGADNARDIYRTMKNIAASTHQDVEMIIALAGEGDANRDTMEYQIEISDDPYVKIVNNPADYSNGAILNKAIELCSSDHIILVRAGDMLHSRFIGKVSDTFNNDKSLGCVGSAIGFFNSDTLPEIHDAAPHLGYMVSIAEDLLSGSFSRKNVSGTVAIRKSIIGEMPFSEDIDDVMRGFRRRLNIEKVPTTFFNAAYVFCEYSRIRIDHKRNISQEIWDYHEILSSTVSQVMREGSLYLTMSHAHVRVAYMDAEQLARGQYNMEEKQLHEREQDRDRSALHALMDDVASGSSVDKPFSFLHIFRRRKENLEMEAVRRSNAFDAQWYLAQYPDVADADVDPLKHYMENGGMEGRYPNPYFNSEAYLLANPDVRTESINPLLHYILHGRGEGRNIRP